MTRKSVSGVRADRTRSYRDIESVALNVRTQLGLGLDAPVNSLELFESLDDIRIRRSDGSTIPLWSRAADLEDSEGFTRFDRDRQVIEVVASPTTYKWLEEGNPRAGYFLAHELGHCVLHTDQLIRLAKLPANEQANFHRGGERKHRACEDTEWQANAFAAALLMPAKGLESMENEHGQLTNALVASRFNVSCQAAGYRLLTFKSRRQELTQ